MTPTSRFKKANQLTFSDAISLTGFDQDASYIERLVPIDYGRNIQITTANRASTTWEADKQVRIYQ